MTGTNVTPRFRIVPAGGSGKSLRATILVDFMSDTGSAHDLECWPDCFGKLVAEKVQDELFDIRLHLVDAGKVVCLEPPDPSQSAPLTIRSLPARDAFRSDDLRLKINRLWRSSIEKGAVAKDSWLAIVAQINQSSSSVQGTLGQSPQSPEFKEPGDGVEGGPIGVEGQFVPRASVPGAIDSVIAVPHADLMVAMEYRRAEELVASLNGEAEPSPINAGQPAPKDGNPDRSAATSRSSDPVTEEQRKKRVQKVLQERRLKDLNAAVGAAEDQRKGAFGTYTAAIKFLQSCSDMTAEGLSEQQSCLAPGSTGLTPADAADPARNAETFDKAAKISRYATWPTYHATEAERLEDIPKDNDNDNDKEKEKEKALAAFHTIQSTPSLARAFLLAMDVEFDHPNPSDMRERYGYLSCEIKDSTAARRWTLVKLKRSWTDDTWHFWPVTRAEMLSALTNCALPTDAFSQYDAVTVMSAGWNDDRRVRLPRYDISTLDVRAATDSELQRIEMQSETDRKGNQDPGSTHLTTGLSLLHRSAQRDLIWRIATRNTELARTTGILLDAEDLTIGQRLAVGLRSGDGTDWRPLMTRDIRFGTSGESEGGAVETVLSALGLRRGTPGRRLLDGGHVATASRLIGKPGGNTSEAVLDEAFATWDGTPMGVDCAKSAQITQDIEDILCFGRTLDLPTTGEDRPHPLRYGGQYRLALLPVYSGGVSLPLGHIPPNEAAACEDKRRELLFYPPSCPPVGQTSDVTLKPFVRMLRHERIAAPVILLPEGHARRRNGPMGHEAARDLVVRSVRSDKKKTSATLGARATPSICQRIILAPTLSREEAARHGLLDNRSGKRPPGAYRHAKQTTGEDRRANRLAFPVTLTHMQKGIDGRQFLRARWIEGDTGTKKVRDPDVVPSGDAVWQSVPGGAGASDYFPDPAADRLVVRLRYPGTAEVAATQSYELRKWNKTATQLPVVLTLKKGKRSGPLLPTDSSLSTTGFRAEATGDIRTNGVGALDLCLTLDEGEMYDVDLWFQPEGLTLARSFAVLQAVGVCMAQKANPGFACNAKDVMATAQSVCTKELLETLAAELPSGITTDIAYVAPGGVAAPSNRTLGALGKAVACIHAVRPLPEISAVQTLTVAHAVNRLASPPVLDQTPVPAAPSLSESAEGQAFLACRAKPAGTGAPIPQLVENEGETGLVLGGKFKLDRTRIDTVEVWGEMILPASSQFDDPDRGRSLAMRRSGTWPVSLLSDPAALEPDYLKTSSLFGFNVTAHGKTSFRKTRVLLLRIDSLVPDLSGELDLLPFFQSTGKETDLPGRVTHRHSFPDALARVMNVWIDAYPRSARRMTTVDRVAFSPDPWLKESLPGYLRGEMLEADPLTAADQTNPSERSEVVLPAAIRPAACVALGPVPVFRHNTRLFGKGPNARLVVERRALVRLNLGRSWFSSGEGERLGIVLWPPRLGKLGLTAPGMVELEGRGLIALDGFADRDLGPGGRFVSRRGGDPVRAGQSEERHLFLGPADFLDYPATVSLGHAPQLVENVPMLPELPARQAGSSAPEVLPLMVSLMTFEPRFDPEREEWYVDLALRPGATAEPFVRLGLVRYQPNTIADLRCSLPVTSWTQPMPDRTLTLKRDGEGDVTLSLLGPAPIRRAGPTGSTKDNDDFGIPCLRFAVSASAADAEQRPLRRLIPLDGKYERILSGRHVPGTNDLVEWSASLSADAVAEAGPSARLHVAEVEVFRPADYPNEPQPAHLPSGQEQWRETGPRFAADVDLAQLLDVAFGASIQADAPQK